MWLFYNLPPPLRWQSKGALATHVPKTREAEELAEGERLCSAVGRIKRTASSSFQEKLKINELPVSASSILGRTSSSAIFSILQTMVITYQ
jgi:hypothetical protein